MVYDPRQITYEDLLDVFFTIHDPQRPTMSGQYRTALFVHGPDQRRRAEAFRDALSHDSGLTVRTPIVDAGPFHPAEDYHQKWILRQRGGQWREWLQTIYPDPTDFRDSTAAARLNGWLAGHGAGTPEQIVAQLGVPPTEATRLADSLGW